MLLRFCEVWVRWLSLRWCVVRFLVWGVRVWGVKVQMWHVYRLPITPENSLNKAPRFQCFEQEALRATGVPNIYLYIYSVYCAKRMCLKCRASGSRNLVFLAIKCRKTWQMFQPRQYLFSFAFSQEKRHFFAKRVFPPNHEKTFELPLQKGSGPHSCPGAAWGRARRKSAYEFPRPALCVLVDKWQASGLTTGLVPRLIHLSAISKYLLVQILWEHWTASTQNVFCVWETLLCLDCWDAESTTPSGEGFPCLISFTRFKHAL